MSLWQRFKVWAAGTNDQQVWGTIEPQPEYVLGSEADLRERFGPEWQKTATALHLVTTSKLEAERQDLLAAREKWVKTANFGWQIETACVPIRGRVSRVTLTKATEVSVVVKFGIDELERAKALLPGNVLELIERPELHQPHKVKK